MKKEKRKWKKVPDEGRRAKTNHAPGGRRQTEQSSDWVRWIVFKYFSSRCYFLSKYLSWKTRSRIHPRTQEEDGEERMGGMGEVGKGGWGGWRGCMGWNGLKWGGGNAFEIILSHFIHDTNNNRLWMFFSIRFNQGQRSDSLDLLGNGICDSMSTFISHSSNCVFRGR